MTKVKARNWSLDRFKKSVVATCKRQGLKPIPAVKIETAYKQGLAVRHAVATLTTVAATK